MPDERTEAEAIWKRYYGDADGLADHLISICLSRLGVVYHVFNILDARSDFEVACLFRRNVGNAVLQKLFETNQGIAFCKFLYDLLNSPHFQPFASCTVLASDLILFKWQIDAAKPKPNQTVQPRKLSDAEINEYKKKAKRGEKFKEEVVWELPVKGPGFVVYNRNDVRADGLDQIGTKETIERILRVAADWESSPANKEKRLMQIGDISRPGGLDTSEHGTHESGKIFDMRPIRNDDQVGNAARVPSPKSPSYRRDLTVEFIRLLVKYNQGTKILYNDEKIYNSQEFKGVVSYKADHDDHLHVMFPGGD